MLKDVSTGAQNDLERATQIVREMITRYGMSDELGPLTFGKQQEAVFLGRDLAQDRDYSEAIAYAIDKEARIWMDNAYHRAEQILSDHIEELHKVAALLIEKETIEAVEFYHIMADHISESEAMREAAVAAFKAEEEQQMADEQKTPQSLQQWMEENNISDPGSAAEDKPADKPRVNMIFDHHDHES